MTRRGTTNSTGNLGGGVLILLKNGLTYTSLSTQSLSSLDPSSDYLAIAVKIKGASSIHLKRLCPFYPLFFFRLSPKILLTLSPTIIPYHLHLWRL